MVDLPLAAALHLPGPRFLVYYGVIVVIVLVAAALLMRFSDATRTEEPPSIPDSLDAIEIAFLSGGLSAVLRTVFYDLRQRGFLTLEGEKSLAPTQIMSEALTRLQQRVLDRFKTGLK